MFSKRAISYAHVLRLPEAWQEGPYCGFYAMSIAMLILKASDKIGWAAPPRARSVLPEHSEGIASLAYVARNYGLYLGGGWVFDMSIMPKILRAVGCCSQLYYFKTLQDFQIGLITNLYAGFPVIVSYDVGVHPKMVGFSKGKEAHYGVVVGCRHSHRTGRFLVEIADGHSRRGWVPISMLFKSNLQLSASKACTVLRFRKGPEDLHHPEETYLGDPDASKLETAVLVSSISEGMTCRLLRNHMVVVYGRSTPFLEVRRRSVISSPGAAPK